MSFPGGISGKEPACQCPRYNRGRFNPWVGKIPWRRVWQPPLVFLPGEFHGQRSLAACSPLGRKELDMTEVTQYARTPWKKINKSTVNTCHSGLTGINIQCQLYSFLPLPSINFFHTSFAQMVVVHLLTSKCANLSRSILTDGNICATHTPVPFCTF